MTATSVPPPEPLAKGPSERGPSWKAAWLSVLAVVLILTSVTAVWFVTESGPFAKVEASQWALDMTEVPGLHARTLTGAGVTVCVVDSGVDTSHPELQGVDLLAWKDLVNHRSRPYDDEGHGTSMAGIIFARGRLPGIAPGAALIAVKAIGAGRAGSDSDVARAVSFCIDPNEDGLYGDGAHVISLSLGGGSHPLVGSATETAVNAAIDNGAIVVAAAGNDGQNDDGDVESPASVPRVIAVGAVNRQGEIAAWSSLGNNGGGFPPVPTSDPNRKPELVAPGVSIATILPDGGYAYVSGTSPAAALVSGIAALLLEANEQYRHNVDLLDAFKRALMDGAAPADGQEVPHDDRYGYGLVQAVATDQLL